MKHTVFSNLILISLIIIGSCTKKNDYWEDVIKLSTKSVNFSANADSITVTTEGDCWWIDNVFTDDQAYKYSPNINPESDNYSIQQDYFIVTKKDKHSLFIKMNENNSQSERKLTVELEAGDYFDRVSITQAGIK